MTLIECLLISIAWMWVLGGGLAWLLLEELARSEKMGWRDVALCVLWPISLPLLVAFYIVFAKKNDTEQSSD